MAKGQQRGNKEAKKPKKTVVQPIVPTGVFLPMPKPISAQKTKH